MLRKGYAEFIHPYRLKVRTEYLKYQNIPDIDKTWIFIPEVEVGVKAIVHTIPETDAELVAVKRNYDKPMRNYDYTVLNFGIVITPGVVKL